MKWYLQQTSTADLEVKFEIDGADDQACAAPGALAGCAHPNFCHVCLTVACTGLSCGGGEVAVYVDGVNTADACDSMNSNIVPNLKLADGTVTKGANFDVARFSSSDGTEGFIGTLRDLRVYDRALSEAECAFLATPTGRPSASPTTSPSESPTAVPSSSPSASPSLFPSVSPTRPPS